MLYPTSAPKCSGGCQSVNGNLFPEVVVETEGDAEGSRGNQSVRDAVIRDGDVGKDFANGAGPLAGRQAYFSAGMVSAKRV